MKLAKITKMLQGLLDPEQGRAGKREAAIAEVLEKLRRKETKYAQRLPLAQTDREIAKLERQLKVCRAQIRKAEQVLGL